MTDVLEKIVSLAEPLLEGTDMFIVRIKNKPTNNIKLFLDADGGLSIDKSAGINRKLYKLIEEEGFFPDGDFSLEVSSPGVDEPLVNERQYKKNIGRSVSVALVDGGEKEGKLIAVNDDRLILEIKQKKKKEVLVEDVLFADVAKTIVQVSLK